MRNVVRERMQSRQGWIITEPEPLTITLRCDGVEDVACSRSGQEWDVEVRYCQRFFVLGPHHQCRSGQSVQHLRHGPAPDRVHHAQRVVETTPPPGGVNP
jgi:hypothetical protein